MIRNCSLEDISDGKLYGLNDMVKASCNDCKGCSACCQGMGNSIVLDPLDIYNLSTNLNKTFEQLLVDKIELNIVDGLILPNLKLQGEHERCNFLNEEGRCSIHAFRPGICRIFPLGRYYTDNTFHYILQTNECKMDNRSKVKVSKWIDTPDLKRNQQFISDWHYFVKEVQTSLQTMHDEGTIKKVSMYILNTFYMVPYQKEYNFYDQFYDRFNKVKAAI